MENLAHLGLPGGVNPLDFLHKLAMQRGLPRPQFQQLGEQGPPHMKVFVWLCNFNNISAQGSGRSKKEAKVAAARAVRDQINYEALPSAPTFQSQMLERKRKQEEELQDSSVKKEPDETKVKTEGNGESATASSSENQQQPKKKAKKGYDYNRHFQCYGTNPGAGPGGPPPLMGMGMPYGYLPEQNMPPHFGGGGGFGGNFGPPGPPFGFDGPPNMMIGMMGGGYDEYQPPEGFGPQVIDPHGFDPFSEGGGGAPGMEDAGPGTGFPVNEMGYALGSMFQGGFGNDMSGGEAVGFHSNMGGGAGYGPGGGGGFNSRLSKLDRYVIKKHTDVYPSEKDLDLVLKLVTDIEETMRSLSNDWNTDEENSVKIEGLVRVGDLAKGLLLASDRVVNVVVLCRYEKGQKTLNQIKYVYIFRSAPTKDMLQKIHTLISTKIKEANAKYETKVSEEYASLEISTKHNIDEQDPDQTSTLTTDLFYCNVIFTSTKLRKKPPMTASATKEEEPEAEEEESKEQEDDVKVEGKPDWFNDFLTLIHMTWFRYAAKRQVPASVGGVAEGQVVLGDGRQHSVVRRVHQDRQGLGQEGPRLATPDRLDHRASRRAIIVFSFQSIESGSLAHASHGSK